MEITKIVRVFKHDDTKLSDPDESMSPDEVLEFYSNQYPELTNASVSGPDIEDDNQIFTFSTTVGTKG